MSIFKRKPVYKIDQDFWSQLKSTVKFQLYERAQLYESFSKTFSEEELRQDIQNDAKLIMEQEAQKRIMRIALSGNSDQMQTLTNCQRRERKPQGKQQMNFQRSFLGYWKESKNRMLRSNLRVLKKHDSIQGTGQV